MLLLNSLEKQKILQLLLFNKTDNLNLSDESLKEKFSFGGKIIRVLWQIRFTKFDITDYVKVSKKQRTNISEKKIKEVLQYSFLGYCYNLKKNFLSINTSFSLRNVLDGFPVEMIFPLYSPAILSVSLERNLYVPKVKRTKLYFLRDKALPQSLLEFDYVSRQKDEEIIPRKKTIKKLK